MSGPAIVLLVVGLISATLDGVKLGSVAYLVWKKPEPWGGKELAIAAVAWGPMFIFGLLLIAVAIIGIGTGRPLLFAAGVVVLIGAPVRWLVARRVRAAMTEEPPSVR